MTEKFKMEIKKYLNFSLCFGNPKNMIANGWWWRIERKKRRQTNPVGKEEANPINTHFPTHRRYLSAFCRYIQIEFLYTVLTELMSCFAFGSGSHVAACATTLPIHDESKSIFFQYLLFLFFFNTLSLSLSLLLGYLTPYVVSLKSDSGHESTHFFSFFFF